MAAVDYFLKLDGIDGESTDDKHKGELEIESFSWGLSNSGSASHGGGGGAGKAAFEDFHFVTPISKASPKLFLACASGEHIKTAYLTARKAGKEQQDFYKVTLSDVLVSGYQQGGSAGELVPTDQVSLNFAKVEVSYRVQGADGQFRESVNAGWDVGKNVKL